MELKDRVIVVTGAGRGIGRATALQMAARGAKVVVNDLDRDVADEVVRAIREDGGEAVPDDHAVGSFENGEAIIATAVDAFGRIDGLFNNAGVLRDAMVHKMTEEEWDLVIHVHLKGTFANTRAAYRHMKEQGNGRIINVTSISGLRGNVGQANYSAAKGGIIGLTKSNAKEFGRYNIQVNAISPNASTRMLEGVPDHLRQMAVALTPLQREGKPEEIAELVCFLASDRAAYITGQIIPIDGGMST